MDVFLSLFTKANITLLLSIIGTIGTVSTFVISFLNKRKRLRISFSDIIYRNDLKTLIVGTTFENKSQLPIAITKIFLLYNGVQHSCIPYPRCVSTYAHKIGKDTVDRINTYNMNLPIDINQLSAKSGYFLFDIPEEDVQTLRTGAFLLVHSTRGKVMRISLPYTP